MKPTTKSRALPIAIASISAAFACAVPFAFAQQQAAAPAAASAADMAQSMVGKPAPDFMLPDQNEAMHNLAEAKGKWVVLAFYPADMTQGCTFQNKSYSANMEKFVPLNAVVYTVSTQDTKSKKQFCDEAGLTHTLLADVGGKVAGQYGVLNGKYARRYTYYIAPDGTIAGVDTKINTNQAAPDSLAMLAKLQAATPAAESAVTPPTEIRVSNSNGAGTFGITAQITPPTEVRKTTGGALAVTDASDRQFVGAANQKVVMGSPLPDFGLLNAQNGKQVGLSTLEAGKKATVLIFVSTQCPVSNAYNARMARLAANYGPKGVQFVGINANTTESVSEIAAHAKKNNLTFPILKDANDKVADQFEAQVTPEVFVANDKGILVYHGPIDDSQKESGVTKNYLVSALNATLSGKPVAAKSVRAFGCSIKRGN